MILRLILIVFLLLAISGSAMTEDQLDGTAMTEMQRILRRPIIAAMQRLWRQHLRRMLSE